MAYLRMILAHNIKQLRGKLNISQEHLADLCQLHRTYISDIERGNRNISIDNIEKLANSLHVTPSDLLKEGLYDNQ